MITVLAFIPLMAIWVVFCGAITSIQLSLAAYRHKKIPDMSAVVALMMGAAAMLMANHQTMSPIFAGVLLFFGGYGGLMAVAMSSMELKSKPLGG